MPGQILNIDLTPCEKLIFSFRPGIVLKPMTLIRKYEKDGLMAQVYTRKVKLKIQIYRDLLYQNKPGTILFKRVTLICKINIYTHLKKMLKVFTISLKFVNFPH